MRNRTGGVVVGICAVVGGASLVAPGAVAPPVMLDTAAALSAGACWIGAARLTGRTRLSWQLLAAVLTAWLAGDLIWDWYAVTGGEAPTASVADLLYVVGYALMLAGVVVMIRLRSPRGNRDVALDAGALALAAALLSWQFLVTPNFGDGMALLDRLVTALYPFADVLILAALAALAWSPGRRGPVMWLVFASLGLTLALDVAYAVLPRLSENLGLDWINALYPLAYSFMAAAALHPDARLIAESEAVLARRLHPARLAFLAIALITAPTLSLLAHGGLQDSADFARIAGSIGLTIIVLVRFTTAAREREQAHEALAFQATHDQLTGLVNRPLLVDRIDHALTRGTRSDASIALLYLDLDGFKTVNDSWGHRAGDQLLVDVARRLRAAVRPSDTVARLGGDEFVVLCEDLAEPGIAIEIAERVVASLALPFELETASAQVSASVGIALHTSQDETAETLLRDADAAMYRAKDGGRDRWELFDDGMRAWVQDRRSTEAALRGAVDRGELRLLYQPEVRLEDGEIVGFEALLRWERPGIGLVAPDQFLGIAEDAGLIGPIGNWVLEQACRQVAAWNDSALDLAPLHISVNVSGREVARAGWVNSISRVLERTGLDPALLLIEISEAALAADDGAMLGRLEAAKRLGIRLTVDNFGTGSAALARLRELPIDRVKIDRAFMEDLDSAPPETTIAAVMVTLSRALGQEIVAEGVETAAQAAGLRRLDCDLALGFHFARPLSLSEAGRMLRGGRHIHAASPAEPHRQDKWGLPTV